jgi:hypothetical protein
MSIEKRLTKLEQRQARTSRGPWALIGIQGSETEEEACERWQAENPGKAMPKNIIYLFPFSRDNNEH